MKATNVSNSYSVKSYHVEMEDGSEYCVSYEWAEGDVHPDINVARLIYGVPDGAGYEEVEDDDKANEVLEAFDDRLREQTDTSTTP